MATTTVKPTLSIGVLALQGSFEEHIALLNSLAPAFPSHDLTVREIRTAQHLSTVNALVIPGGESTAIALIAKRTNMLEPLKELVRKAKKGEAAIWGTCAGMILLGEEVVGAKEGAEGLGGMDVKVVRNQWGRQVRALSPRFDQS